MSSYPPDGWTVDSGTWGTDFDRNTAVTNLVGDSCIEFKPTATACKLLGPLTPIAEGDGYRGEVYMAGSGSGTGSVYAFLDWYDKSQAYISQTSIGGYSCANSSWASLVGRATAPSNARYARIELYKPTTMTGSVYVDYTMLIQATDEARMTQGSSQTIPASTWTDIVFDTGGTLGRMSIDTGTGRITPGRTGRYMVLAAATLTNLNNGDQVKLKSRLGYKGTELIMGGAGAVTLTLTSLEGITVLGTAMSIQVWHNSSNTITTSGSGSENFFQVIPLR